MPTQDRTTIKTAMKSLMAGLRAGLVADPPTLAKPFRKIEEGEAGPNEYVRPFMTVRLTKTEPLNTTEGDKIVQATLAMRLVTDVVSDDPHDAILDAVGAVEDYFDNLQITEQAVVEGADGLDDRQWTLTYPVGSSGTRIAQAGCEQTFVVKVQRAQNRVAG
ncbi:MAG: hypothetical protein ACE5GE_01860 [Phycisphaerae bacterium]